MNSLFCDICGEETMILFERAGTVRKYCGKCWNNYQKRCEK
jgi:hypothetical protein